MFTGVITLQATLQQVLGKNPKEFSFCAKGLGTVKSGESLACNGACLTALQDDQDAFQVAVSLETLRCTTLGNWRLGQEIHVEKALLLSERLEGHILSGHIDATAKLLWRKQEGACWQFGLACPKPYLRFLAPKGSVALDGVSLTVGEVNDQNQSFEVNLLPLTLEKTHFGSLKEGDALNLEVDMIARYLARLASYGSEAEDMAEDSSLV